MTPENKESERIDIDFTASPGFSGFLASQKINLVISTYQTGSIFTVAPGEGEYLTISVTPWRRPMGLAVSEYCLYVGGGNQIWRFNNIIPLGAVHDGYNIVLVPQQGWTTGDLDIHDVGTLGASPPLFINTRYSCVARVSSEASFLPVWSPPHVTRFAPDDQCHLNGMAFRNGELAYVSAFSQSTEPHGWRKEEKDRGVLWDIASGEILVHSLRMPHSPRWYAGRLWLLESGTNSFGFVDVSSGRFESIVKLPGYVRGLSFHGNTAFIGASIPREGSGIREKFLSESGETEDVLRCAVYCVDLVTGKLLHVLKISGGVQEIYDIAILANATRARLVGLDEEDLNYLLKVGERSPLKMN
jgi:uncharacterized protein (TIGR03032 family)